MDSARFKTRPAMASTATSTSGMLFGWVTAVCASAALVLLTIKLGVVLFT